MHKSYLLFASNKRHFNCLAIPGKYILYNKLVFFSLLELQLKHKMKFPLLCFVFLVSVSFSAGNLDDNLNVNHDHETEYENELLPILDFPYGSRPILENPFDSNYFEDLGSGFESNMFEEV